MKKKSPRGIPDFSPKRAGFQRPGAVDLTKTVKPAPPPAPKMKPPHTSTKSGNRGQ